MVFVFHDVFKITTYKNRGHACRALLEKEGIFLNKGCDPVSELKKLKKKDFRILNISDVFAFISSSEEPKMIALKLKESVDEFYKEGNK